MDDTIYRQAAIDAIKGIGSLATLPDNDTVIRTSAVEYVLFNIPSAQPEIIYCKDCKYNYGLTHGGEFNPDDIVCMFFDTDGMQYFDFCSYGEERKGAMTK